MNRSARPALCELRFESRALNRWSRLVALVPQSAEGPFPTLYLLHGFGGDADTWVRDYDLAGLLGRRRLMIVMPEGGHGYYVNDPRPAGQGAWEDHVIRDVVATAEHTLPALRTRTGRLIAGNSMGGYGAVQLALRHPDLFAAAFSLSGSMYFAHEAHPRGDAFRTELMAALPDGAYDLFRLATALAPKPAGERPALAFHCGLDDHLLPCNRAFHAHLKDLGWKHDYAEFPGRHDRAYWSAHLPALLDAVLAAAP